jgi:hypothetical protein
MTARPDATSVHAFLGRASWRVSWLAAAEGATVGLIVAALVALAGWPTRGAPAVVVGAALVIAGVGIGVLLTRARRTGVAALVERRAPQCRNVVITANELAALQVADHIASLVYEHAARAVQRLDLAILFPARRRLAALGVAAGLWALAIVRTATAPAASATEAGRGASVAGIEGIDVTVVPPKYAGRPTQTLRDPARIEALAGSTIRLSVRGSASRIAITTLHSTDTLTSSNGAIVDSVVADADGYVAIAALAADGRAGARRMIGISAISDEPPRVRITAPGRDVYLKDGHAIVDVAIETSDDIGLASLRLRYTRVSGSGERFTFSEGDAPLAITRRDARAWTARAAWRLDSLTLGPGDMVVYRAVAADHRPGAPPSESDSYIAEVVAPGGVAAAGFALDPEQERYAVSQQMVILKTERLSARKATMADDAYASAAQDIAAEQRKVRAEFVFMMGGELADAPDLNEDPNMLNEEQEAEGEGDLAAGRNLNQGRIALLRAIRSMSRAATSLTNADLSTALSHERAALVQLERAFSRTRILLRALSQRERLDLMRRLTGTLADAGRDARPAAEPELDTRSLALRRALAGIAALAGEATLSTDAAPRAANLAESVLRVDASSKPLQSAAALLSSATTAISANRTAQARDLLDRAATEIAGAIRVELPPAPRQPRAAAVDRLDGAFIDQLRGVRGAKP